VLNVTLCCGRRFRAVPPGDPIRQAGRRIGAKRRAIRDSGSDLVLVLWAVLHWFDRC
jgi:hypothetical protein